MERITVQGTLIPGEKQSPHLSLHEAHPTRPGGGHIRCPTPAMEERQTTTGIGVVCKALNDSFYEVPLELLDRVYQV